MEEGGHEGCPIELRSCPKHEFRVAAAELELIKEAGAVPIQFPTELSKQLKESVSASGEYVGYCVWCGHGYRKYTPKLEAEHFANYCPNAPQSIRDNAKRRLGPHH